ncbi:MAG TPA: hypothetical protein VHU21_11280 [Paraburkholderia sp.]|nr:hypothetical protein [Paraburkholderia sp.]
MGAPFAASQTAITTDRVSVAPRRSLITLRYAAQDEFFYVVNRRFLIELEDRTVDLRSGQAFVVRKSLLHRPRAPEKTVILMVEEAEIMRPAMRDPHLTCCELCSGAVFRDGRKGLRTFVCSYSVCRYVVVTPP